MAKWERVDDTTMAYNLALMEAEEINGVRVVITKVAFVREDIPGPALGRFEGFIVGPVSPKVGK